MKIACVTLLLGLLLSCASINNSYEPKGKLNIYSLSQAPVIKDNDTLYAKKNKLTITTNSTTDTINLKIIKGNNAPAETLTIQPERNMFLAVLSYGISKDYSYPKVYLDEYNNIISVNEYSALKSRKNGVDLYLSFPYINNFVFKPFGNNGMSEVSTGFMGANLGVGYYYNNNHFVDINFGGLLTHNLPIAPPIHRDSGKEYFKHSLYLSLANNHRLGRFIVGYGITVARNYWGWNDYGEYDPELEEIIRFPIDVLNRDHTALGLNFPLRCEFGRSFYLGLVYKPYFYQFGDINKLNYQHTISFEFGWRINLYTKRSLK